MPKSASPSLNFDFKIWLRAREVIETFQKRTPGIDNRILTDATWITDHAITEKGHRVDNSTITVVLHG